MENQFEFSVKEAYKLLRRDYHSYDISNLINQDKISLKCNFCKKTTVTNWTDIITNNIPICCRGAKAKCSERNKRSFYALAKKHLNGEEPTTTPIKPKYNRKYGQNTGYRERQIVELISDFYDGPIRTNVTDVVHDMEIDIYLPEKKIAIEVNSLIWHSEDKGGRGPDYHLSKTLRCQYQGIEMYHLFLTDAQIKNNFANYKDKLYEYIVKRNFPTPKNNIIRVNRNFNIVDYYLKKGYSIIEVIPPREHFINDTYTEFRESQIDERYVDKFYDCGEVVMVKNNL